MTVPQSGFIHQGAGTQLDRHSNPDSSRPASARPPSRLTPPSQPSPRATPTSHIPQVPQHQANAIIAQAGAELLAARTFGPGDAPFPPLTHPSLQRIQQVSILYTDCFVNFPKRMQMVNM